MSLISSSSFKTYALIICVIVTFFILRVPGISVPYYQDEWKNVSASETVEGAGSFFAHPPLMQILFVFAHNILGDEYMRLFPLLFSFLSIFLLYAVIKKRAGQYAAYGAVFLYIVSFYSVLGALVPDVDGAILPFFFLLALYAYDNMKATSGVQSRRWFVVLGSSLLVGFLIKLSFIIAVLVFALLYILEKDEKAWRTKVYQCVGWLFGFSIVYGVLLYVIAWLYPAFDINLMLGHANQFSEDEGRNWTQIIVQSMKAIYYVSPLLVLPLFYVRQEDYQKTRIFFIYLLVGFVFYFILFDFSRGALDKYLMFAIVPLSAIIGVIGARIFTHEGVMRRKRLLGALLVGVLISSALFFLNFIPHEVVPLYPKSEWFSKALHFEWNILNPFNGGSGPLGFYVSFLFIVLSYIVSFGLILIGLLKRAWRKELLVIVVMIGLTYNIVFVEEFVRGDINGSAPHVLEEAIVFLVTHDAIDGVLTYNDIGAHELTTIGKYDGRFYAAPQFEENHKERFADHIQTGSGSFLVVDIPHINPASFYGNFFAECDMLFEAQDGKIRANVYSCAI